MFLYNVSHKEKVKSENKEKVKSKKLGYLYKATPKIRRPSHVPCMTRILTSVLIIRRTAKRM